MRILAAEYVGASDMRRRQWGSNPLALAVLACVIERPMHPYEVATTMRERAKHESIKINYGSLYGVVERLADDGLIEAQETEREGRRPERTIYAPTEAGRTEFVAGLTELLRTPTKEYPRFEAGLSLMAGLPPADVAGLLHQRCAALTVELAAQRAKLSSEAAQALPRLFVVELEFHIAMREAELTFTRALAREIADATLDGVELWRRHHAT